MSPSTILAAALALAASPLAFSGSGPFYAITKTADYVQKSSASAVANPYYPCEIIIQAPTEVTLTQPGGISGPILSDPGNGDYEIDGSYSLKTALDASFPDGTYTMTGSGIPTLSFSMTPDSYPPAVPSVTGGTRATWSGGVLVVDPAKSATINFSTFTTYATAGMAGHMEFDLKAQNNNGSPPSLSILSASNPFGITVQKTPFTSDTIPAGTLASGGIYEADLQFETALKFDATSLPGKAVLGLFQDKLVFYIVAPPSGIAPAAPVLATDLSNQSGYAGGSATFAPNVTVGGASLGGSYAANWYLDGQRINIDGSKYVSNGTSLIVNGLTADDAGRYYATFVSLGGLVTTSQATLTIQKAVPPAITYQPLSETLAVGSDAAFSVAATGGPKPTFQWQLSSDGGSTWQSVPDSYPYSGQTTSHLGIVSPPAAMSGDEFRCVATSGAATATSSAAKLIVNKKAQTISFPQPASVAYYSSLNLIATASSHLPVSLSLVSGSATLQTDVLTPTNTGSIVVSANQAGDATYLAAPQVTRTVTVVRAAQKITFAPIPDQKYPSFAFQISAQCTSNGPIVFTVKSGPATIAGRQVTVTGVGKVTIEASQVGDSNFLPAPAVDQTFTVTAAPS